MSQRHPQWHLTPDRHEWYQRNEFTFAIIGRKVSIAKEKHRQGAWPGRPEYELVLEKITTLHRWNCFPTLPEGMAANHWRVAEKWQCSAQEWREAEEEGRIILFWQVAMAMFENNSQAQEFFRSWNGGIECRLFMLGAECNCRRLRGVKCNHAGPSAQLRPQWSAARKDPEETMVQTSTKAELKALSQHGKP